LLKLAAVNAMELAPAYVAACGSSLSEKVDDAVAAALTPSVARDDAEPSITAHFIAGRQAARSS
jgi:hypothetical protein